MRNNSISVDNEKVDQALVVWVLSTEHGKEVYPGVLHSQVVLEIMQPVLAYI
jgi:hypothetical protein